MKVRVHINSYARNCALAMGGIAQFAHKYLLAIEMNKMHEHHFFAAEIVGLRRVDGKRWVSAAQYSHSILDWYATCERDVLCLIRAKPVILNCAVLSEK